MSGRRRTPESGGRYMWLLGSFVAILCGVGVRLVWIQGVSAPSYAAMADGQRSRDTTLPPRRGAIYDREGEQLAGTTDAKTVYATPHAVKDAKGTARTIAKVLGGDAAEYERKLRKQVGFVYIARKVDVDRARALEDLDLVGIDSIEDSRRVYPCGELACQLLGFVGVDDSGLAGLERQYDDILAGTPGRMLAERDPYGRLIPGGVTKAEDPVDGENIVITIDKDIQYEAQVELAAAVEKWSAKSGSVVVMDPRSGEILAMASTPGFDPNRYSDADPGACRNRPVCDTYEPGSTIKTFTAAAAIDSGIAGPTTEYRLPSTIRVGGRTIHEAHGRRAVVWSLTEIVTRSSNIGAVKVGQQLGAQRLYRYLSKFGFTSKTGIDFPGEVRGWLPPPSAWSASSIGNIPFGQGISATPLQLARALAVIANGGELVTPHLLLSVPNRPDAGITWPRKRVLSAKTARTVNTMLKAVVTDGTGSAAAVRGYAVAGKTGTAQKPRADGRGYKGGGYVGSFSGYLPADDPRVLIVVTLDEPSDAIYGGTVAAPTFGQLADFAVSHLKVPPSSVGDVAGTGTDVSTTPRRP